MSLRYDPKSANYLSFAAAMRAFVDGRDQDDRRKQHRKPPPSGCKGSVQHKKHDTGGHQSEGDTFQRHNGV